MKKVVKIICGCFLIASLDISVGIFLSIIVSAIYGIELTRGIVVFGIIFSVLPDIDFLWELILKRRATGAHKKGSWLHYPLIMFLIPVIIFWYSNFYAMLGFACLFCHFLHDIIEISPGIALLGPFSEKRYLIHKREGKLRFLLIEKELIKLFAVEASDIILNVYMRFGPKPILGASSFVVATTLAVIKLFS